MYDIFNVEYEVYNKQKADSIVRKIKALNKISILKRDISDTKKRSVDKNAKIDLIIKIKELKRTKDIDHDLKIKKLKSISKGVRSRKKNKIEKQTVLRERIRNKKIEDLKLELFNLMAKVVVKNIANYVNLSNNSSVTDKCHEKDEMQAEAWIILENCVNKFKNDSNYCFYFYYNKALSRNFYRMFFNTCQTKDKEEKYVSEKKYTSVRVREENSMKLLVESLGLSDFDERVLNSRLKSEKKADFLAENPDFSAGKYYSSLKNIKEIIFKFQKNGNI